MACSKKDFVAIAAIMAGAFKRTDPERPIERALTNAIAHDLAHYFGSQNAAFDKERFLKACGLTRYVCGDGTRFSSLEEARKYAAGIARRTGAVISIEEVR